MSIVTDKQTALLAARLIDHGHGLLDISMASYNFMVQEEIPTLINDLRPIVWVEKPGDGSTLCLTIRTRFASLGKPMLNANQILLPLQAQQLDPAPVCWWWSANKREPAVGRSYTGRLLVNVEISVKQTLHRVVVQQQVADIKDLCIGEIPILVGSVLCHQRHRTGDASPSCFFVNNGQAKVIVSQVYVEVWGICSTM